jgi:hypothetical protein
METILTVKANQWDKSYLKSENDAYVKALEKGQVLYYPDLAFTLLPEEQKFLSTKYSDGKAKNISYYIKTDKLGGAKCTVEESMQLKELLNRFRQSATKLVSQLFPSYVPHLEIARTSYRPVEILGRKSSYKKDDTRLHVDAFYSSPNQGKRILRVFSNINPNGQARVWRLGEPFEMVANRFLPAISQPIINPIWLKRFKITKSLRTPYDHIMLKLHDTMKNDLDYQKNAKQIEFSFLPNTTWIVQTDHVSHAAMSGQFLLEQTFYLPVEAMNDQSLSPLRTLERMKQRSLVVI